MNLTQLAIVFGLLALWMLALLRRDHFQLPRVGPGQAKLTHVLPAVLQVTLFIYWSMYWPDVVEHLPSLAVQLVVAYVFDFLLGWTLRRAYTPTFGPVPIVLSMNLFVWFPPDHFVLYALVIAIALSSKSLLLSGGRHIFNPSVLGLAVVGLLCTVLPWWFRYQDIAHDFDRPPYMAQVILLLALIPQIRLGTAPVAVGAAVAMIGTMMLVHVTTGYRGGPSPCWAPWLLAITLLAGDPATIPSRPTSRLLFGLFLGAAFYVVSRAMLVTVGTDFFAKIIPIPLANLLIPSFERAADWLTGRWPGLRWMTTNPPYVAAWLGIALLLC